MAKKNKKQEPQQASFHDFALDYLQEYYQSYSDENFYFGFPSIKNLVEQGENIAHAEGLEGIDYESALLIVCFRFAGITNIFVEDDTNLKLLRDFTSQMEYPEEEVVKIETAIRNITQYNYPTSSIEKVAWDAIGYNFTLDDMIVQLSFLKEEINRINENQYTELEVLLSIRENFVKSSLITDYAKEHYSEKRDRNFSKLEKRIQKLREGELKAASKEKVKVNDNFSNKETEDLFKIAFRNYVNLVSVADSKAGLLINVNSIIISVVIAFVVGHTQHFLPSIIILTFSFITILLSILASRPQGNHLTQDANSKSYQTFFFGSFDLMGNEFSKADWNTYSVELDTLLKGGKDKIFEEMYKESYNVRKVLGKKFTYLSAAYLVFLGGLFISIIAFIISMYQ
jgi:Family of unknown function (DUF5706)